MARIVLELFIDAPQQQVWDLLTDISGQERWMVDVRRLDIVSEVKSGVGTVMDVTNELFGLPILHDVLEIVSWEPPSYLGIVHRGQFTGTAAFKLEPALNGVIFTWIEEFKPPLGWLGERAYDLVVGPHLRSVFGHSMANVKRIAEAEAQKT